MRYWSAQLWLGLFVAGVMSVLPALGDGGQNPTTTHLAQIIVTVRAPQAGAHPVLNADDVMVYVGNQRRPVVSWVAEKAPLRPLDLTILVDDSARSNLSLQFRDLADFFRSLPTGTRVSVAYASYGGNRIVQDFTGDYALAAKALRLPLGSMMAGASVYESVGALLKKWPDDGNRRGLLLISDGLDINLGIIESEPYQNIELQQAIKRAQSTNVPIYTIFATGAGSLDQNWFLQDNGQGCLALLASETGGQSYFQGTHTPLDFAPFLKQFSSDLRNQYVLTFQALAAPPGRYQRLRVTTEVPHVKLFAPTRVFIPKAG